MLSTMNDKAQSTPQETAQPTAPQFFAGPHGALAYLHVPAKAGKSSLLFLHGLRSDMRGSKAEFLAERCAATGLGLWRLDLSGHGQSDGVFTDGNITSWQQDVLAFVDAFINEPTIIIGSSLGGWLMLLLALARPQKIKALIGIAAAPDFTETLIWNKLSPAQQAEMTKNGFVSEASIYGEPLIYSKTLIESGRQHLLLDKAIALDVPVRLLQGMADDDVPWQHATEIATKLTGQNMRLNLIKDGDHRLSRAQDLSLLWQIIEELA